MTKLEDLRVASVEEMDTREIYELEDRTRRKTKLFRIRYDPHPDPTAPLPTGLRTYFSALDEMDAFMQATRDLDHIKRLMRRAKEWTGQ